MSTISRASQAFWSGVAPGAIPSKLAPHPHLLGALEGLRRARGRPLQLLDLGCGDGQFALELAAQTAVADGQGSAAQPLLGCVVGLDCNERGVAAAVASARGDYWSRRPACWHPQALEFAVADVTGPLEPLRGAVHGALGRCGEGAGAGSGAGGKGRRARGFDAAMLQLLISVVGTRPQRDALLRNCAALLAASPRAGGGGGGGSSNNSGDERALLCLSASGDSAAINPAYAAAYAADYELTGEERTYCSRDAATGEVLYQTHHFQPDELERDLVSAGFGDVEVVVAEERSSRRPEEKAVFLYATATI